MSTSQAVRANVRPVVARGRACHSGERVFAPCEGCWRRRDLSLWRGAVWLCRGCVPREGGPSWLARVAERLVERLLGTKGAGFGE